MGEHRALLPSADDGVEGVILGCTEIELLIGQEDSPVPVLPTTLIHANAALELALGPVSPEPAAGSDGAHLLT